jgi:hypothetical protein
MKVVLFVINFFRMKIEEVFRHVGKQLSLRQAEKKGHQMEFDSKQWLSQTDELQSEPVDFERRMLSKACFTSDKLTRFY